VARDAGCNPLGVRFRIRPKRIASNAANPMLRSALLCIVRSIFDGNKMRLRR